jgi:hypothetical protein
MVIKYLCPVCGFKMEAPPEDYNTCASCGTEFGFHDRNSSIEFIRRVWVYRGMKWWSPYEAPPPNWNPKRQLSELLESLGDQVNVVPVNDGSSARVGSVAYKRAGISANIRGWETLNLVA